MNSMHNSFTGPGGYSAPYPGYVPPPPSALPYYNGYPPGELSQNTNPYYGKATTSVPPGYTSTMTNYSPSINNSTMYYQQYGLGYQYGYSKYGLGYSSELSSGPGIHPPPIGTLQAPTTDLGLTGSMFSKNNKFSGGQGSSSPHASGIGLAHGSNSSMMSPATPNTPSPGPHNIPSNLRGAGATPSPPVEAIDAKKDIEKMKRCPTCGQVFRLMNECIAHIKAVHESPLNVYNLQHGSGSHIPQSLASAAGIPTHSLSSSLGPPTSRHGSMGAPDSPLMALERMGWGEKQNLMSMQSSPLTSYTPAPTIAPNSQHLSIQHNQQTASSTQVQTSSVFVPTQVSLAQSHPSPILHSPAHQSPQHPSPTPPIPGGPQSAVSSTRSSPAISEGAVAESGLGGQASVLSTSLPSESSQCTSGDESQTANQKQRKTNSYSVSSIIGETPDQGTKLENIPQDTSFDHTSKYEALNMKVDSLSSSSGQDDAVNLSSAEKPYSTPVPENDSETTAPENQPTPDLSKNTSERDEEDSTVQSPTQKNNKDEPVDLDVNREQISFSNEDLSLNESHRANQHDNLQENSTITCTSQDSSNKPIAVNSSLDKNTHDDQPNKENIDELATQENTVQETTEENCELDLRIQYQNEKQESLDSEKVNNEDDQQPRETNIKSESPEPNECLKQNQSSSTKAKDLTESSQSQSNTQENAAQCQQHSPQVPLQLTQPQRPLSQQPQQQSHNQIQSQRISSPQQISSPQLQSQNPQSSASMYHAQSNVKQQSPYGNWPLQMGPNYSGQYPYGCGPGSNAQPGSQVPPPPPNSASSGQMCSKPHAYSPVHSRYPSQYHPPGISGNAFGPHEHHMRPPGPQNYAQSHPHPQGHNHPQVHPPGLSNNTQGNWYPPGTRPDSKSMWNNWPNQGNQSFPQGFYGYPGSGQLQGQKHHVQQHPGPPPAHVHPSHSPHMINVPQQSQQSTPQQPTSVHKQAPHNVQQSHSTSSTQHLVLQSQAQIQSQHHPMHQLSPQPPITSLHQSYTPGSTGSDQPKENLPQQNTDLQQNLSNSQTKLPLQADKSDSVEEPRSYDSKSEEILDMSDSSEKIIKKQDSESSTAENDPPPVKRTGHKIGPKSKILALKQTTTHEDTDSYKCSTQENGSLNGYGSQSSTGGQQSCDSSDSEVAAEEGPTFTLLRPVKRKSRDGTFVGPKRIKLARQVRERQERRQKHIREQIRQSEYEEQLIAQRAELVNDRNGPLANILLQSSILLADKKVEGSESVEECIAFLKAEQQSSLPENSSDGSGDRMNFPSIVSNSGSKKPGRKAQTKVFHNANSVIIKDLPIVQPLRKLRAKDFKWSHYIKSMRYWCGDCAQGFKNQKEAGMHTEDRCKWNCLYMLECYVVVNDIQNHPQYGSKVQELLEEYQVDGQHNCMTCGDVIARKADYLVHVDSHKDFNPWECTICGSRFKIRGSLKEHLRYTHMKGRVPCLKCNKVFPTSTLLRQHVKTEEEGDECTCKGAKSRLPTATSVKKKTPKKQEIKQ